MCGEPARDDAAHDRAREVLGRDAQITAFPLRRVRATSAAPIVCANSAGVELPAVVVERPFAAVRRGGSCIARREASTASLRAGSNLGEVGLRL